MPNVAHRFTDLEEAVLAKAVEGPHPALAALRSQLGQAEAGSRRYTGHGFYVDIKTPKVARSIPVKRLHIPDVAADVSGLKNGAGFVLFIEDGRLRELEGFAFDEPWPSTVGEFQVFFSRSPDRRETIAELDAAIAGGTATED